MQADTERDIELSVEHNMGSPRLCTALNNNGALRNEAEVVAQLEHTTHTQEVRTPMSSSTGYDSLEFESDSDVDMTEIVMHAYLHENNLV